MPHQQMLSREHELTNMVQVSLALKNVCVAKSVFMFAQGNQQLHQHELQNKQHRLLSNNQGAK